MLGGLSMKSSVSSTTINGIPITLYNTVPMESNDIIEYSGNDDINVSLEDLEEIIFRIKSKKWGGR
jgi:hypothetical protein